MRLKIVNTTVRFAEHIGRVSVVNADTNEPVECVKSVSVRADESTGFIPIAVIELEVDTDLTAFGHIEAKRVIA